MAGSYTFCIVETCRLCFASFSEGISLSRRTGNRTKNAAVVCALQLAVFLYASAKEA